MRYTKCEIKDRVKSQIMNFFKRFKSIHITYLNVSFLCVTKNYRIYVFLLLILIYIPIDRIRTNLYGYIIQTF